MNSGSRANSLVSIIMCVYNAGKYLRPSVESVLTQTYRNIEFLIVDDGSTDGCMDSIADLPDNRIRIIRQKNKGKPAAMNVALEAMRGEFYAINDADDLSHPERIQRQVQCLLDNSDLAAVYCGHELILDGRHVAPTCRGKSRDDTKRDLAVFRMPAHDPTGMYRWSLVKDMRYEDSLPIVEGFDYMLRVGERHPVVVLGKCLYSYRIHMQSVTKRNPERRDELVREVLKRACIRRGMDYQQCFPSANGATRRNRDVDNNLAAQFMDSACDMRRVGRPMEALRTGLFCSRMHPLDLHYHKALFYAVAPMWLVERVRLRGSR